MDSSFASQPARWSLLALLSCLVVPALADAQAQAQTERDGSSRAARGNMRPSGRTEVSPAAAYATSSATSARQQIDVVYQTASQAKTLADIQRALDECERLGQQRLANNDQQYLAQLQAWLLNRRGEARALSASRASEAGQEAEALQLERQAIEDFSASIDSHPQWRAYHNRGVSLAMLGEYDQALASFDAAIELKPDYPNTRFNRAELWLERGEHEKAEREYSEVVRLDPEDVDSLIGRGHARFYLAQFEAALADFDQVIQSQPENAVAYADRADLFAYLGKWEPAARDYRMAVRLDKGLGRAYQNAAWLMSTCPDERFRDDQLALRAAKRAIDLDGDQDYRYLDTLAAAQANAGLFDDAVKSLQKALATAPEDVHADLRKRLQLYQNQRPFRDAAR